MKLSELKPGEACEVDGLSGVFIMLSNGRVVNTTTWVVGDIDPQTPILTLVRIKGEIIRKIS